MDLKWLINERYAEILEKLYERHEEIKNNRKKEPYYQKTLAKALKIKVSEQAISKTLKILIDRGAVKVEEKSGPNKGKVKYLSLTDEVLIAWIVLTPLSIKKIKKIMIERKKEGRKINPSEIAIELGKNPNDKMIMDIIYAVWALPEVRNCKIERIDT